MIPRFSLYRELDQWENDIQLDPTGQWVRMKDVGAYITYALGHGFVPPPTLEEQGEQLPLPMVDKNILPEELEETELEGDLDLYDLVTQRTLPDEPDMGC